MPSPARLFALALAVHGSAAAARATPTIVVSVAPQRGIVERIAGDGVEVVTLVPPGADVESFSPTVQQIAALERAALVFWVGHPAFPLESRWLAPWLERHPQVPRVALVDHDRAASGAGARAPREASPGDPHLWMSPRVVRRAAVELAEQLARRMPEDGAAIRARGAEFDAEVAELDARLAARLGGGGRFLVDHPSLGYLARDYGLEQVALEHEGKEPTPARLAGLVERARREGFRVVLAQRGASRRGAELLARELGAQLVEIDPLAADWVASVERIAVAVERALVRD